MGKRRIYASIDQSGYFVDQSLYVLLPKESRYRSEYHLALICSTLLGFVFNLTDGDRKKTFPKIKGDQIKRLPIRPIDFDNPDDVAKHDNMVTLVERMLALHQQKAGETNPHTLKQLETHFTATDRQIDRLVYQLYDLTDEEIALVEQD